MTNHDLINKIKVLKEIRPDEEWKESARAVLMSECRRSDAERKLKLLISDINRPVDIGYQQLFRQLFHLRPAMAAVLVIIFTIAGCAYGLNISQRSLPGEMFWNVKVSLEKAQTTFSSGEAKVKLETELAGKRLEELKEVSPEEKPKAVAEALENFKIHINEAKKGLEELENRGLKSASPESPTEVGTPEGEEPTKVGQNKLAETYAAITAVEDEYGLWEEELIGKIEARLRVIKGEVKGDVVKDEEVGGEVEGDEVKDSEVVNALIEEAEVLLEEGRLVEALEKILEVEKMME